MRHSRGPAAGGTPRASCCRFHAKATLRLSAVCGSYRSVMPRPSEIAQHLFQAQGPDDGYSPEILITGIARANLNAAFDLFRTHSANLGSTDYIWHKAQARELPLVEVSDPIALLVSGEGEEFHVLFHELAAGDARLHSSAPSFRTPKKPVGACGCTTTSASATTATMSGPKPR